ncbi:glycosyltransferase [Nocardia wallacei]|uniref:glycosyltransferase n=1 Tax=Nocardia wallacei TaxID=480035 RepID=UPI002455C7F2|nr:glycosyltransferase [Nocardia wallacei]
MRILVIGPTGSGGSIPPYLNVLTAGLRQHGAHVDRLGSPTLPYDSTTSTFWPADRIIAAAHQLLTDVDLSSYDVLSLHFGNLEIEQLLPTLWGQRNLPPVVYHVHSLDWTLFTHHVPNPELRAAVDTAIERMNGFLAFGEYGRRRITHQHNQTAPSTVSWLPTTIPTTTPPQPPAPRPGPGLLASLYGYAAPWKDAGTLLNACANVSTAFRMVLAGPFWDDQTQAGIDLTRECATGAQHGRGHVDVTARYLDPGARKALAECTDIATFPYRSHSSFQGSGAIADYLAHGVPILATDVANMTELIGDAGHIVEPDSAAAFADGLDRLLTDHHYRNTLRRNAERRRTQFSSSHHAATCLRLYETVTTRTATTS